MNNTINDPKFFKGGNAIFTVSNPKEEHYTFKIKQPKGDDKPFFVSLLTGPMNDYDYSYMGIYNPNQMNVYLTKKSRYNDESTPVKVIRWAIKMITNNKEIPEGYAIQHEGKCCCCGRTLTTPVSIQLGIGPECAKRLN